MFLVHGLILGVALGGISAADYCLRGGKAPEDPSLKWKLALAAVLGGFGLMPLAIVIGACLIFPAVYGALIERLATVARPVVKAGLTKVAEYALKTGKRWAGAKVCGK